MNQHDWQEFQNFTEATPVAPPEHLDARLSERVRRDLHPPLGFIFTKLTATHFLAGVVTLTFCPQFGVSLSGGRDILFFLHALEAPVLFYALCGLIFIGSGAVLAPLFLTRDELRTLSRRQYLFFLAYSPLAYVALSLLGDESFHIHGVCWLGGALAGHLLGLSLFGRLRSRFV